MRVISRAFCTILAAALAALSVVILVEIALAAFSQDGWLVDSTNWFDTLSETTWSSSGFRLATVIVGAVGMLLLAIAWAPRRPLTVPTRAGATQDVALSVRRREAEELLRSRVAALPYVSGAHVQVTADRVDVSAHTTRDDTGVNEAVETSVAEGVDHLALGDIERRVRLRRSTERVA